MYWIGTVFSVHKKNKTPDEVSVVSVNGSVPGSG